MRSTLRAVRLLVPDPFSARHAPACPQKQQGPRMIFPRTLIGGVTRSRWSMLLAVEQESRAVDQGPHQIFCGLFGIAGVREVGLRLRQFLG
ncbi:MAG: hypothetical protein RLZZ232_1462, partial [Planctomycetota bacterium]